jgi:hypothetical protein
MIGVAIFPHFTTADLSPFHPQSLKAHNIIMKNVLLLSILWKAIDTIENKSYITGGEAEIYNY